MKGVPEFLQDWLRLFAQSVRNQDFNAGKKLFHADSISFGTVCSRSENLDELVSQQWQIVWPNTEGFDFEYASARATVAADLAVACVGWQSTGFDKNLSPVSRQGRATIVLQKFTGDDWLAIHSHFSLNPTQLHDPVLWHTVATQPGLRFS
jgi:ketosteroid isomerase-like protein